MSLPGVESARRRRVCHGRSSVGFLQAPPLRRRYSPQPAIPASFNPLRFLDPADRYIEILNERAIAARHRLDERLRDSAVVGSNRRHAASSIPRPMETQPRAMEERHGRKGLREMMMMSEEKFVPESLPKMGGQQDDCPVCLDTFLAGQTVLHLPCNHTFHRECIVPWLQNHCHCPSCRANIS